MRNETTVVQVKNDPKVINEMNQEAAIWGWSVQSVQITEQKVVKEGDSHQRENIWGDKVITETEVITEHINYATITYQRDLDDPRTQRLAELEKAYNAADKADLWNDTERNEVEEMRKILDQRDRDNSIGKLLLIATGVCFVLGMFGMDILEIPMFICLAASLFFYGKVLFTPMYRTCQQNYDHHLKNLATARRNRKEELLKEAKNIHLA